MAPRIPKDKSSFVYVVWLDPSWWCGHAHAHRAGATKCLGKIRYEVARRGHMGRHPGSFRPETPHRIVRMRAVVVAADDVARAYAARHSAASMAAINAMHAARSRIARLIAAGQTSPHAHRQLLALDLAISATADGGQADLDGLEGMGIRLDPLPPKPPPPSPAPGS